MNVAVHDCLSGGFGAAPWLVSVGHPCYIRQCFQPPEDVWLGERGRCSLGPLRPNDFEGVLEDDDEDNDGAQKGDGGVI